MPPIFLIHGIKDTARKMKRMETYLRQQGREVYSVTLTPSWGQVGLEELAEQLKTFIDAHARPAQPIDLVGFSMGGLVARYYVQRLDGLDRVKHLVTLGTPHHGTWTAFLLQNTGSRQMRPGSDFLCDLEHDSEQLKKISCTSIWTPFDLIIIPATSSRIDVGRNVMVPAIVHPLLVWCKKSVRAVAQALDV
jgi:triacylglycerol lipase